MPTRPASQVMRAHRLCMWHGMRSPRNAYVSICAWYVLYPLVATPTIYLMSERCEALSVDLKASLYCSEWITLTTSVVQPPARGSQCSAICVVCGYDSSIGAIVYYGHYSGTGMLWQLLPVGSVMAVTLWMINGDHCGNFVRHETAPPFWFPKAAPPQSVVRCVECTG